VDIIEATKRAGKALQPVQDNKFRKNFRSNDRTITNEPRIGSPDQENFIGGKINIRVNEFDRNFSQVSFKIANIVY
jgi:ribosomal protein S17E